MQKNVVLPRPKLFFLFLSLYSFQFPLSQGQHEGVFSRGCNPTERKSNCNCLAMLLPTRMLLPKDGSCGMTPTVFTAFSQMKMLKHGVPRLSVHARKPYVPQADEEGAG